MPCQPLLPLFPPPTPLSNFTSDSKLVVEIHHRLIQLKAVSEKPSSAYPVSNNLHLLVELWDSITEFIRIPHIRHVLCSRSEQSRGWVEPFLDCPLGLLDTSVCVRDALTQTTRLVWELQSSLRRTIRQKATIDQLDFLETYVIFRKKKISAKMVRKCSRRQGKEHTDGDQRQTAVSLLRDAEETSRLVLESVLDYITVRRVGRTPSRWRAVYERVTKKQESCDDGGGVMEKVEAAVSGLKRWGSVREKDADTTTPEDVFTLLGRVETGLEEMEEKMRMVFKALLRARVGLLNAISY